jgi:hypothetical protein
MTMDARYIAQSDNTAVTTWANRGSSTYNMTQATAAAKPTFRDGTNGLNGLPTLSFDGGDYLESINTAISTYSIVAVASRSVSGADPETIFNRGSTGGGQYQSDVLMYYIPNTSKAELQRSNNSSFPTASVSSVDSGGHVLAGLYDGTNLKLRVDFGTEATAGSVTSSATAPWSIGVSRQNASFFFYFKSKISLVAVWSGTVISASLSKRTAHAASYSFKIACS